MINDYNCNILPSKICTGKYYFKCSIPSVLVRIIFWNANGINVYYQRVCFVTMLSFTLILNFDESFSIRFVNNVLYEIYTVSKLYLSTCNYFGSLLETALDILKKKILQPRFLIHDNAGISIRACSKRLSFNVVSRSIFAVINHLWTLIGKPSSI